MSIEDELKKLGFSIIRMDAGDTVLCDGCNEDMTDSPKVGGVLLQRSAFCPDCAPRIIKSAAKYNEERFLTYPKEGETFYNFVLRIR